MIFTWSSHSDEIWAPCLVYPSRPSLRPYTVHRLGPRLTCIYPVSVTRYHRRLTLVWRTIARTLGQKVNIYQTFAAAGSWSLHCLYFPGESPSVDRDPNVSYSVRNRKLPIECQSQTWVNDFNSRPTVKQMQHMVKFTVENPAVFTRANGQNLFSPRQNCLD